jgi:hypothetical protein
MKPANTLNGTLHALEVTSKYLKHAVVAEPSYLQNLFDVYQQIKCILWSKITNMGIRQPSALHTKKQTQNQTLSGRCGTTVWTEPLTMSQQLMLGHTGLINYK